MKRPSSSRKAWRKPPAHFSRAVLIGNFLYIAGTSALSHVSGDYYKRHVPKSIEEQTRLTLDNIRKCVEAVKWQHG